MKSTIVDSNPIPTCPPSMIISMASPRSSSTCSAIVGLGLPDVLALGAATKPPPAFISSCAILSLGNRTATLSRPPVVSRGTISAFGRIMVSGPGQYFSARILAPSGISVVIFSNCSSSAMCTISGLSDGLPFAAYIFMEACGSSAFPPSPYTVSVGNATSPPAFKMSPAFFMASISRFSPVIATTSALIIISPLLELY